MYSETTSSIYSHFISCRDSDRGRTETNRGIGKDETKGRKNRKKKGKEDGGSGRDTETLCCVAELSTSKTQDSHLFHHICISNFRLRVKITELRNIMRIYEHTLKSIQ